MNLETAPPMWGQHQLGTTLLLLHNAATMNSQELPDHG
jgi:hypothetical protein